MMLVPGIPYACSIFGSGRARRQRPDPRAHRLDSGYIPNEGLMAERASLQLIGLVLAGMTAGVIVIAAMLVFRSSDIQLADRPVPWQAEQAAVIDNT